MIPVILGIVDLVGADKQPDPEGGKASAESYLAQVEATLKRVLRCWEASKSRPVCLWMRFLRPASVFS
jgi:hypothetical protein